MENKIASFFWFDKDLKEIIAYYRDIFNRDSKVSDGKVIFEEVSYNLISSDPANKVEMATIKLFGTFYHFMGAKRYAEFNESFSLMINTEDQAETDYYWDAITKEGKEIECGWCKDKYGMSWQVIPKKLLELNTSPDKSVASYAMQQMMKIKKIIIKDLEK